MHLTHHSNVPDLKVMSYLFLFNTTQQSSNYCKHVLDNLTNKTRLCPGDNNIAGLVSDNTLTTNFGNTSAMQEAPHLFLTAFTLVICSASCKTAHLKNYKA